MISLFCTEKFLHKKKTESLPLGGREYLFFDVQTAVTVFEAKRNRSRVFLPRLVIVIDLYRKFFFSPERKLETDPIMIIVRKIRLTAPGKITVIMLTASVPAFLQRFGGIVTLHFMQHNFRFILYRI